MISDNQQYALTIAGFDPSGGAGILADIKTFEKFKVYGFAVSTATTFQNENEFSGIEWNDWTIIKQQLEPLKKYNITVAKIGIVRSFEMLHSIVNWLKENFKEIKIIWDTVFSASAGFQFIDKVDNQIIGLLKQFYLITPNLEEANILTKEFSINSILELKKETSILLKGGHGKENISKDVLYLKGDEEYSFEAIRLKGFDKHGTGCILSAAITACLVQNKNLETSCQIAKKYVFDLMKTSPTKLGNHFMI